MSRWRALFLGAAAAVAGCSLVVSTDGLAGAPAGVGSDGGEAGTTPTGDGSTSGDANAEAGTDAGTGDAATTPFCASRSPKPKYCADFDTGALSDYGRVDGTTTIDTTVSRSAPSSMLAVVEANATLRHAKAIQDFADAPASFTAAFDILVDEYDSAHDVELLSVLLAQSASKYCVVTVSVRTDHWTFDETCQDGATATVDMDHRSALSLQPAHWTHVHFSLSFGTRTFSMSIDGQSAFAMVPLQPLLATGQISLAMGINYLQTAATSRAMIHLDNVTFDYP